VDWQGWIGAGAAAVSADAQEIIRYAYISLLLRET
jgi:hypothetical protein